MSHLEYYTRHGISPVHYDVTNLITHFERRQSLYRSLGVLPLAVRNASVLEVAAGSGQNSLFIASLMPRNLTLLEPNATGVAEIRSLYETQTIQHTKPVIHEIRLEDYVTESKFDIVICENWLGSSAHERRLLRKLATFVADDGIMVVTAISPVGLLPNMIRRALAAQMWNTGMSFETRTTQLVAAFAPHLATMKSMTRNAIDWVHDNMMNPAYFDLCLTIPMVLRELGASFQVLGTSPSFAQDWRWFKSLHGSNRSFNEHFLQQYAAQSHNFLDYRDELGHDSGIDNDSLERPAMEFIATVREFETCVQQELAGRDEAQAAIVEALEHIAVTLKSFPERNLFGLREAIDFLSQRNVNPAAIGNMPHFKGLFGRETLYVSLLWDRAAATVTEVKGA
jgi:ubiquinone/menaquinone biosynthesis C-methylase UbiE